MKSEKGSAERDAAWEIVDTGSPAGNQIPANDMLGQGR